MGEYYTIYLKIKFSPGFLLESHRNVAAYEFDTSHLQLYTKMK